MSYQELLILLPCHSLEDFPTYHEGDDAQSLLASWSALWHPELIASAAQAPGWKRADDPPSVLQDRLIVVPTVCMSQLPTGFIQRCKEEGACLVRKPTKRDEIVSAALAFLGERKTPVADDLAADFLALGYCYLQIELLTRQMRYSSNLDEVYFKGQTVAAALAAVEGNTALAQEKLAACFSVLAEERDHYYPVDAFLLDLNLIASTTLGPTLRQELARLDVPAEKVEGSESEEKATNAGAANLLLPADLLNEMAAKEPETLAILRAALERGNVGLIGGEATPVRSPLLSNESILAELRAGLAQYELLLGRRPEVYGRWRFGLSPVLPGILHRLGFKGALHTSFEDGKVPEGSQFKVRWEGLDGSAIDAIARPPLDASKPQTFLSLATKLGESMDSDHVATLCLAHWPGQACEWLGDLQRIARYSAALGKFVTVEQYFRDTDSPGQIDRFEADRYRSPYLKQAVIRKHDDPISTQVNYWRRTAAVTAAQAMDTLATLVTGNCLDAVEQPGAIAEETVDVDAKIAAQVEAATNRLQASLTGGQTTSQPGALVLNPCSYVRRLGVEVPELKSLPPADKPLYAADEHNDRKGVVIDVPPLGFAFIPGNGTPRRDRKPLALAEDTVLRNEFFEAIINPTTGTLTAIHEYGTRGNRLSQQLAIRMPGPKQKPGDSYRDPDETALYSVMAADSVEITSASTAMGEIVARGRLVDLHGKSLCGFQQTYRVWRGSRVLQIEIELDPQMEPKADPWNSYYCLRWAWADEAADMWRSVNQTRQPIGGQNIEAPHYIEISDEKHSTTLLTGGLPFHRRNGERMLDTLLITRGERGRKFKVGVGIDLTHPLHEALGLLVPRTVARNSAPPSSSASGWLFHLDAKNVVMTSLAPLVEENRVVGFRARLLETAGRPANLSFSSFRGVQSAETVDFLGQSLCPCKVEAGKIQLSLAASEWVEVVARW
jgi:alpha-mannosidase